MPPLDNPSPAHPPHPAGHDTPKAQLNARLDSLQARLPHRFARWLAALRRPKARMARIPLGVLLMVGGVLGFLPILGFWMLPVGAAILAIDVPFLRKPMADTLAWIERRLPA